MRNCFKSHVQIPHASEGDLFIWNPHRRCHIRAPNSFMNRSHMRPKAPSPSGVHISDVTFGRESSFISAPRSFMKSFHNIISDSRISGSIDRILWAVEFFILKIVQMPSFIFRIFLALSLEHIFRNPTSIRRLSSIFSFIIQSRDSSSWNQGSI